MKWLHKVHNFLLNKERLDSELNWISKVWYLILLISTTIFVLCNYNDVASVSLLKRIDIRSLIFVLWLVLLVLPLFESFEGFGVRVSRNKTDQKQLTENIKNMTNQLIDDKVKPIDTKEIEEMLKKLDK
ncbi:MAG: hypothetical protein E7122_01525 [Bacteroidales bacterium]|nr:hypothetical protein [Bacteroidales bacterium]